MSWLVRSKLSNNKRRQLIREATQVLLQGEQILDVTGGLVEVEGRWGKKAVTRGALVVTDRRVFLQSKPGLTTEEGREDGYDVQNFAYEGLTDVNYSTGKGFNSIELVAANDRTTVTQVLKDEVARIGPVIRRQMALHPAVQPAQTPEPTTGTEDPADQPQKDQQPQDPVIAVKRLPRM